MVLSSSCGTGYVGGMVIKLALLRQFFPTELHSRGPFSLTVTFVEVTHVDFYMPSVEHAMKCAVYKSKSSQLK